MFEFSPQDSTVVQRQNDSQQFAEQERENFWSIPVPANLSPTWGSLDAQAFIDVITQAYAEVVQWRPNLFLVPFGKVGCHFVHELARLYRAFAEGSALECIRLPLSSLPSLYKSLTKIRKLKHTRTILNDDWRNGCIEELLAEGQTIQRRSFKGRPQRPTQASTSCSRCFSKLMFQGKCGAALTLLTERRTAGVLKEDDILPSGESVYDAQHPSAHSLA